MRNLRKKKRRIGFGPTPAEAPQTYVIHSLLNPVSSPPFGVAARASADNRAAWRLLLRAMPARSTY
ncbi:hypothetical protein [Paenibacillus sp. N3.4]|uniref:hypothetical protein n=1 Tax=Paenibacillus sp. N3.4 TaxID=2603222 RepID=UPI001650B72E|nr:hypothetical protein [Paenibacillus sp. N3.4]